MTYHLLELKLVTKRLLRKDGWTGCSVLLLSYKEKYIRSCRVVLRGKAGIESAIYARDDVPVGTCCQASTHVSTSNGLHL